MADEPTPTTPQPNTETPVTPQPQPESQPIPPAITEQPVVQAPTQNYQAPTTPQQQVPYEQQPVQQQYFAQPNAAPVQYVVQAQSLKGNQGWLGFFMIVAGLMALTYASLTVTAMTNLSNASAIATAIFSPLLLAAAITSVALIAMEKRIARNAYIGFASLVLLYNVVITATLGDATAIVTGILTGGVWLTFVVLYFATSKRVKETLVK